MSFVNEVEKKLDSLNDDVKDIWDKIFELYKRTEEHGEEIKKLLTDKAYEEHTIETKKPKKAKKTIKKK
tara:strand:+ start:1236 stop:1442 length:207 start_codon:yes stop_codon:yes gene_type:complete